MDRPHVLLSSVRLRGGLFPPYMCATFRPASARFPCCPVQSLFSCPFERPKNTIVALLSRPVSKKSPVDRATLVKFRQPQRCSTRRDCNLRPGDSDRTKPCPDTCRTVYSCLVARCSQRFACTVDRFNGLKYGILTQFPEAQDQYLGDPQAAALVLRLHPPQRLVAFCPQCRIADQLDPEPCCHQPQEDRQRHLLPTPPTCLQRSQRAL